MSKTLSLDDFRQRVDVAATIFAALSRNGYHDDSTMVRALELADKLCAAAASRWQPQT